MDIKNMKSKMNKGTLLIVLGVCIILWGTQVQEPFISLLGGWCLVVSNDEK